MVVGDGVSLPYSAVSLSCPFSPSLSLSLSICLCLPFLTRPLNPFRPIILDTHRKTKCRSRWGKQCRGAILCLGCNSKGVASC